MNDTYEAAIEIREAINAQTDVYKEILTALQLIAQLLAERNERQGN